jgi:hypothetical protein
MAKNNTTPNRASSNGNTSAASFAYKPFNIGIVITRLMEEQTVSKEKVAAFMKVEKRQVERWMKATYLPMPRMMKLSELFRVNLVWMYHPNVPSAPNPLQAEADKAKEYKKEIELLENENGILKNRIIKLEAKNELLEELVEKKNGR